MTKFSLTTMSPRVILMLQSETSSEPLLVLNDEQYEESKMKYSVNTKDRLNLTIKQGDKTRYIWC